MVHLIFLLVLYFLPSIVAGSRHVEGRTAITLFNLFLGWTFIGWIVALIWAIAAPAPYIAYVHPPYPPYYR
ncbi:MAG: superinfection immunity protein [Terracidiphilus sp.]